MNKMKYLFIVALLFYAASLYGQTPQIKSNNTIAEKEIKRLYAVEQKLILNQDTVGMKKFYPEDFVVTNPFGQFINKQKVIERVKGNIIKYSSYERKFDYFKFYGNTAIVIGSEIVIPTQDANRSDAGKIVNRRFTEVWMKRGLEWKKVVRHASNVIPE
jgi:ketosteroid isomerase-like protein